MNCQSVIRLSYRIVLRLHPEQFRKRFGEEMLWIYDQASHNGETCHLLFDGIRSLMLQHAQADQYEEPASPMFALQIEASSLSVLRCTQGGILAIIFLLGFALLLTEKVPKLSGQNGPCSASANQGRREGR